MRAYISRLFDRLLHPIARRLAKAQADAEWPKPFEMARRVDRNAMLLADALIANREANPKLTLSDWEFSIFSQFGEDGIIQYLIRRVPIAEPTFVEFGVENYLEANTRFLLARDNWSGLVIDGGKGNVERIEQDELYFRHDLTAVCSFITRENINSLIAARFTGDLGLLSVDIDGNDYWVWEAIDVVSPRIVICEFNSVFGPKAAVSVPYRPDFVRSAAHYSHLYFGASLAALCHLGTRKGYVFVGCNQAGNNAFFVRKDVAVNVKALSPEEGYVTSKFRESRNPQGKMVPIPAAERLPLIAQLPVFDVRENRLSTMGESAR